MFIHMLPKKNVIHFACLIRNVMIYQQVTHIKPFGSSCCFITSFCSWEKFSSYYAEATRQN